MRCECSDFQRHHIALPRHLSASMYDCIVVGIGGHGSAVVAELAKAGQKVLGIEQFKAVHANGSSHGRTRIYRQAYFEDPKYVPLLKRSLELWHELDDFYKTEVRQALLAEDAAEVPPERLLELCGGIMIGTPESEVVSGVMRSIVAHEMEHEIWSAAEMRKRFPMFKLADNEVAVYESNAGVLLAELSLESFIRMARKNGADLHFEEKMVSWDPIPGAGGVTVRTNKGTYSTKKLVLSVGAWAPSIYGGSIEVPLYIERRVLYWFKSDDDMVAGFLGMPIYIWDLGGPGNFYGFPSESSKPGEVKVAFHMASAKPTLNIPTPEHLNRTVSDAEIQEIRAVLQRKIPAMNNDLLHTATCMYTSTPDNHFVIDFHPDNDNVVLVSPCSGHGFKFISVVGEIVKDLVCDGTTTHDISLFSLQQRDQQQGHLPQPTPPAEANRVSRL